MVGIRSLLANLAYSSQPQPQEESEDIQGNVCHFSHFSVFLHSLPPALSAMTTGKEIYEGDELCHPLEGCKIFQSFAERFPTSLAFWRVVSSLYQYRLWVLKKYRSLVWEQVIGQQQAALASSLHSQPKSLAPEAPTGAGRRKWGLTRTTGPWPWEAGFQFYNTWDTECTQIFIQSCRSGSKAQLELMFRNWAVKTPYKHWKN